MNKTVLVTGACINTGVAIVEKFASEGYNVVFTGRNSKKVKEAEVEVALVKPEYILKGTIDLIQGHGDKVDIVDFKSEKKPDIYEERDKIERYRR